MSRSRTWAAAAIAAGCIVGVTAAGRAAARRHAAGAPYTEGGRAALAALAAPTAPRAVAAPATARTAGAWITAALATAIVLAAVATVAVASTRPHRIPSAPLATLEPPLSAASPVAALAIPTAPPLPHRRTWRWAQVVRAVAARSRPGGKVVARLRRRTPEGTVNIVLVTRAATRRGRLWVRVRLPILPNGSQGWVLRSALGGYTFVDTHLVVSLRRLRATLYRAGRAVFAAPVGIGAAGTPTPRGQFYVRDRLTGYSSSFYGPVAFGTSARSAVLTEWPAGGFIGIHGTNAPGRIPGRPSHGCIRMRNRDIVRLARIMPVGTPVTVE